MKAFTHYIIILLALLLPQGLFAQVSVKQTLDSIRMMIGEQAHLRLTVSSPKGAAIEWPQLQERQSIIPGVEVVSISSDSTKAEGNVQSATRVYTITSFDESLYAIPALKVKVNGKVYQGNNSALKVITMDVDTLHPNNIFPPKDVQNNPFDWNEWKPLFWLSLLMVVLVVAFCFLFVRMRENKPIVPQIRMVRYIPPHKKALTAINKIKEEHLDQAENQKEYYTELTDTLRKYIQERFGFNALEMTSDEIIEHLEQAGDSKKLDELRELFRTADLVKFAKYATLINENDRNLVNAINFIDENKQDVQEKVERVVQQLPESEQKKRENRIIVKIVLAVVGIAAVALLTYVCYNIYLLSI